MVLYSIEIIKNKMTQKKNLQISHPQKKKTTNKFEKSNYLYLLLLTLAKKNIEQFYFILILYKRTN